MSKQDWRLLLAYKATGKTPEQVAEILRKIESGELVEVVRCGECRFCLEGVCYGRGLNKGKEVSPTGFCDRGCRR